MIKNSHAGLIQASLGSLLLSACWYAYHSQELPNFIDVFIGGLILASLVLVILNSVRKSWGKRVRESDSFLRRIGLWAGLINLSLLTIVLVVSTYFSLATIQYDQSSYWWWMALRLCAVPLVFFVHLFSRPKRFSPFLHLPLFFLTVTMSYEIYRIYQFPSLEKEEAVLLKPLTREPFIVLNGGMSRLNNSRMGGEQFRHLYSFINTEEAFFSGGEATAEARRGLSFGKTVYAPASGTVVEVRASLPDNPIGQPDPNHLMGNYVMIQMELGPCVVIASLKENSVTLAKGDSVVAGQAIGAVGYSGLISECVLVVFVIDSPDVFNPETRTLPIYFEGVQLKDRPEASKPLFPRRNDLFLPDAPR